MARNTLSFLWQLLFEAPRMNQEEARFNRRLMLVMRAIFVLLLM